MGSSGLHKKTLDRVKKVRELVAKGQSAAEACKEVGIGPSFFYTVRKKIAEEAKEPKPRRKYVRRNYEVVPITESRPESHAILVTGTPEQLAEFWKKVKGGSNA